MYMVLDRLSVYLCIYLWCNLRQTIVCLGLHHRSGFKLVIFWNLIPCSDKRSRRNHISDCSVSIVYYYPISKYISFFFFFFAFFPPILFLFFSIIVETVVRSSVMPVLTMNCLCLPRQSLFGSVIPATQYLYRGALLMCHKMLLQDSYCLLVFG